MRGPVRSGAESETVDEPADRLAERGAKEDARREIELDKIPAIEKFWKGIWEEKGHCQIDHPSASKWCTAKREQVTQTSTAPEDDNEMA